MFVQCTMYMEMNCFFVFSRFFFTTFNMCKSASLRIYSYTSIDCCQIAFLIEKPGRAVLFVFLVGEYVEIDCQVRMTLMNHQNCQYNSRKKKTRELLSYSFVLLRQTKKENWPRKIEYKYFIFLFCLFLSSMFS